MNINEFNARFVADLDAVKGAEKITREKLREMSRYMLEALHDYAPDIRPVNDLLDVLTPVNKRVAIEFFIEFTGFMFDKKKAMFTGKDKKAYDAVKQHAIDFLEDPMNNIWSWAARNIEVEKKVTPFDPSAVTKAVEKQLKKANAQGVQDADVDLLLAVLEGGVSIEAMVQALNVLQDRKEEFAEQLGEQE